jgi:S-adenosylmethionine hydrolase
MCPIITLTTDFGLRDHYVAAMKGKILGICPDAKLIDITHEIEPQDIVRTALVLESCYRDFPAGTIHLVVVDPGVGSSRFPLALFGDGCYFVGPDNGLFSFCLRHICNFTAVKIHPSSYSADNISSTFHGRDIFAPAAAKIAAGIPLENLGEPLNEIVLLKYPLADIQPTRIVSHCITWDHYGNLIFDLSEEDYRHWNPENASILIETGGVTLRRISSSYSDALDRNSLVYFGSSGKLEMAVRSGNAHLELGIEREGVLILEKMR